MNTTNNTHFATNTLPQNCDCNQFPISHQEIKQNTVSLALNTLYRFLSYNQNTNFTLDEIERISSITYKLISSNTQIKSTEFKERNLLLKEEEAHKLKSPEHSTHSKLKPTPPTPLPEKIFEKPEDTKTGPNTLSNETKPKPTPPPSDLPLLTSDKKPYSKSTYSHIYTPHDYHYTNLPSSITNNPPKLNIDFLLSSKTEYKSPRSLL